MKITALESIPIGVPFTHGARKAGFAGQDWSKINMLLIRVEIEERVVGWGDAFAYSEWRPVKDAFDYMIAPQAIGREVGEIGAFIGELAQLLHIFGRNGVVQYALSGLDIGLWDARAKLAGMPLHELIGGARRTTVPGYASLFKYGDREIVAEKCAESVAEGFRSIKLHETKPAEIAAARAAVGENCPLMVDVNCAWTSEEALKAARSFRDFDIHWLEEPIFPPEDFKALAACRRDGGLPIALGENICGYSDFEKALDAQAVDIAQPSVIKLGGISAFIEVEALCRARGVPVVPHSPYYGPGLLATLQLAAAMRDETRVEWFKLALEADLFGGKASPVDGIFHVPTGNGLGCDPDQSVIDAYRLEARPDRSRSNLS